MELIEECQDLGREGEFSPCFTELQRDFLRQRPTKVKSLIRLVKHWYQKVGSSCLGSGGGGGGGEEEGESYRIEGGKEKREVWKGRGRRGRREREGAEGRRVRQQEGERKGGRGGDVWGRREGGEGDAEGRGDKKGRGGVWDRCRWTQAASFLLVLPSSGNDNPRLPAALP